MTALERTNVWRGRSLIVGLAALAFAVVLGWIHPSGVASAYRYAAFACLQPAVGCLIFLLIFRSTGGQWGEALEPLLVAGTRLVPWLWLLVIPLIWLAPLPRTHTDELHGTVKTYLSPLWVTARSVGWLILFFVYRWLAEPLVRGEGFSIRGSRYPGFGPVGLIVLTFSLHLLAVDWLFALDPGWFSTAFPLIWMSGQALMGISLAVLGGLILGFDPAEKGSSDRAYGIDWGNLLLTATIFWTYVSFMQFLIIWSGNIAREVTWYVRRSQGPWLWVVIALALLNLALPFFLLLSRKNKKSRFALGGIAALLLASQALYTAWIILPGLPANDLLSYGLDAALLIAAGGLFLNRYLSGAAALWRVG